MFLWLPVTWLSGGQLKNWNSQKFFLQTYVTWNCDTLQKYSAVYAGICKDDYWIDEQECMGVEEFRMAMPCSVVVIRFNPQIECENLDSTIGDEDIRQLKNLRNTLEGTQPQMTKLLKISADEDNTGRITEPQGRPVREKRLPEYLKDYEVYELC